MSVSEVKAQYACDACRHRKIGCSRDRPKCENCLRWPGPCIYTSRRTRRARNLPEVRDAPITSSTTLEQRVQRLESLVQDLTLQVQDASRRQPLTSGDHPDFDQSSEASDEEDMRYGTENMSMLESSPNSYLSNARQDLEQLKATGIFNSNDALKSFSKLSNTFTKGVATKRSTKLRKSDGRQYQGRFFIPDEKDRPPLMQVFLDCIDLGGSFFQRPPPDVLAQLITNPEKVEERAWVVIFNCIVSTASSLENESDNVLGAGLHWNTRHALDDVTMFLEPSIVKIQAFVLLATHSYDFATPSFSWMLIGQACQMFNSLGFQDRSSRKVEMGEPEHLHAIFWSLFSLDTSLSLAFGRPPFLSGTVHRKIPFPMLWDYNPHLGVPSPEKSPNAAQQPSFGTLYFYATFELSILIRRVYHILDGDDENFDKTWKLAKLIPELTAWKINNIKKLSACIALSEPATGMKSTELALKYLDFRYFHLITFMTKKDNAAEETCLSSARQALTLLSSLVSNAQNIYNGVVWELLYYPFVPFFVLFGNIIANPGLNTTEVDLQLLRNTVDFFRCMDKNHPHSSKLQRIAGTFLRLAEKFLIETSTKSNLNQRSLIHNTTSDSTSGLQPGIDNYYQPLPSFSPHSIGTDMIPDTSSWPQVQSISAGSPSASFSAPVFQPSLSSTIDLDSTIASDLFTHWLPAYDTPPSLQSTGVSEQGIDATIPGQDSMDYYMRLFESNAIPRPMEGSFDWFSWDWQQS